MRILGEVLYWILFIYTWLIIFRVIIGWLPVRWPGGLRPLVVLVYDLTEPVLSPLRRVMPTLRLSPEIGLDLSPVVAIVVLSFLQWLVKLLFY